MTNYSKTGAQCIRTIPAMKMFPNLSSAEGRDWRRPELLLVMLAIASPLSFAS